MIFTKSEDALTVSQPQPSPDDALAEQRQGGRERVLHRAVFVAEDGASSPSCIIVNLSEGGARIQMPEGETPPLRGTLIDVRTGALHQGHVVWRSGSFAGVSFSSTSHLEEAPRPEAAAPPTPLRILAVDDDRINRFVLEKVLSRLTCEVSFAVDGQSSVDAFERSRFDVVLMDLRMPGMDGFEAIRRIREFEEAQHLPRTPIIVVSAHDGADEVARAASAGADEHMVKPVAAGALLNSILHRTSGAAAEARA